MNHVSSRVPLSTIGDENLRNKIAGLADSDARVSLRDLAAHIDDALQTHFECLGEKTYQLGIGVLEYEDDPQQLQKTIERIAVVGEELAENIVDVIVRDLNQAGFHNPYRFYHNVSERTGALINNWSDFSGHARRCGLLGSDVCNVWMNEYLTAIEKHAPDAFSALPSGTTLFRARYEHDGSLISSLSTNIARALGAAPFPFSKAQRANPARIPCFYASAEPETCLSELRLASGWLVVLGRFTTNRTINVLDLRALTNLAFPASVFADDYKQVCRERGMLRAIPKHFSEPSWPGEDETHYLPTQYFAEFLRRNERERVDGIVFPSTQRLGGTNYALFAEAWSTDDNPVRLTSVYSTRVVSTAVVTQAVELHIPGIEARAFDS